MDGNTVSAQVIRPVILCGGSGTRLWPLSTPQDPKQFLALTSHQSMIAETYARVRESKDPSLRFQKPLIVGSKIHSRQLRAEIPEADLVLEPFGRNSAPAVAAACLQVPEDTLLLILPADHDIRDVAAFHAAMGVAAPAAKEGAIVTFGITPTYPATGYGYIQTAQTEGDIRPVEAFVEKPDEPTAQAYLSAGGYFWNAGIFMFSAGAMLDALNSHAPDIVPAVKAALPESASGAMIPLQPDAFAKVPNISIDYAVLEHADNVMTVPVSMGWSDVGDFRALWALSAETDTSNAVFGPVLLEETRGAFIRSEGPVIVAKGVSNMTIVATPETVMIAPMGDSAAVKSFGTKVQSSWPQLGVDVKACEAARDWLWNAFDLWADIAWDDVNGGFAEQLSLDGTPDYAAVRRTRVQARQIFSFARAIQLGWPDRDRATALVEKGLDFLNTAARHPDAGWVHTLASDGAPDDVTRDCYDTAFIILACAAAFQATGSKLARDMAYEALNFVENDLRDEHYGGWSEANPPRFPRRANPHMHLLEAMIELYDATGDRRALEVGTRVVDLFETHLFDPITDTLGEYFEQDWSRSPELERNVVEPGHHYEWAVLLGRFEKLAGRDTLSWQRRLVRKADEIGREPLSGFAVNAVRPNGHLISSDRRLWPQLEMFRSRLMHPGLAPPGTAASLLDDIMATYLTHTPKGTWIDQTDTSGRPNADAIPASILYHMVTAFSILVP